MERDGFWDRNQRFSYLVALEQARRIREDPNLLDTASQHLERFSASDRHQAKGYMLWRQLLTAPIHEIVDRMTERSPDGDYLRQTAPSFGALPADVRSRLVVASRSPIDDE